MWWFLNPISIFSSNLNQAEQINYTTFYTRVSFENMTYNLAQIKILATGFCNYLSDVCDLTHNGITTNQPTQIRLHYKRLGLVILAG